MEGDKKNDEEGKIKTLASRPDPTSIVAILKQVSLKSMAWVGVYLLGYFNFSIGWMVTPLLLSVLRDQWKKQKRNRMTAARESALTNEQAMLEARMGAEDLPSWVFFPDKDRAEWMNTILKQLWPYVNNYVRGMLFDTVEPLVNDALKGFKLNPFKFNKDRVFMGQVPPRITGIKVYDENTSRKEIIMDLDMVFASDMEIEFKIKGIPARVTDFGLRGMLRIVLKPLISEIPLVGGVQAYFLKAPEIDYSLGGVAGALEIPGLNKIVEKIILEQVNNFIVLPNKFSMPLVDNVLKKTLKCPDSAGVLRVKLIRAKDLVDKDGLGSGKSDPYAVLTVGATTYTADTIVDNLNPEWNKEFDFPIEVVHGQELFVEFYDDDERKDDEFLGRAKVQTSLVAYRGHIEGHWVDLVDCEKGSVQLSLSWLPVTADPTAVKDAAKRAKQEDTSPKCLVHLYVDSVSGLMDPRDPAYMASPVVQLMNGHQSAQKTWPKYNTNDPVIEQGFVFLVQSPYTDEIIINVHDTNKGGSKKEIIGTTSIRIWSLIDQPNMEYKLQPFILKGSSPSAQIGLSVSLRGLLPANLASPRKSMINRPSTVSSLGAAKDLEMPTGLHDLGYDDMVRKGKLRVTLHRAEDLVKKDIGGKADPYVVITYDHQSFETKVCKKTLEPSWEQEFHLDIEANGENQVKMELFDKDKVGKDETMGWTTVDVRRVSRHGELIKEWDKLLGAKKGKIMWTMVFFPEEEDPKLPAPELSPSSPVLSPYKEESPVKRVVPEPIETPAPEPKKGFGAAPDDLGTFQPPAPEASFKDLATFPKDIQAQEEYAPAPVDDLGYMGPDLGGFLRVTVHRAEDLMDKDIAGKSDPYVVIKYAGQKNKSKHIKSELNPEFEFSTGYVVEEGGPSRLTIELKDHDVGKDESLGYVEFDIRNLYSGVNILQQWATLQEAKKGRVQVSLEFSPVDGPITPGSEIPPWSGFCELMQPDQSEQMVQPKQPEQPIQTEQPKTDLTEEWLGEEQPPVDVLRKRTLVQAGNGKIKLNLLYNQDKEELKVFVHEAAGLPGGDLPDPPDPQVKIYLMPGKKKKKKTDVVKDSVEPRFDEEFDFDIDFKKLPQHSIKISVVDKKGVFSKSPVMGSTTISLDNPGLRQGLADWYPLEADDEDSD